MLKILLTILIVLTCLFLLSLIIYFFNLDMKLAAAMIPIMNKIYDRGKIKRKKNAVKAAGKTETERKAAKKESAGKANETNMDENGSGAESV